jgi:RHS repeat-associated protein
VSTAQQLAGGTSSGALLWAADPPQLSIDSNGNLTSKTEGTDTWAYEWDAEDQLKRVLKNGVEQARFAYDALGRRVEKVAAGATTGWAYDGDDIVREVSGATTLKNIHGPESDEPLAQEDGSGALSYFHADGLGSIVKTSSGAGGVTASRRYDAFGNVELGATNGYAFTGREWDEETGLTFSRARYLDNRTGRFLSEDPIHFSSDDLNFYSYVHDDPVNWTDPSGLLGKGHSSGTVITPWGPVHRSGLRRTPKKTGMTCIEAQIYSAGMAGLVLLNKFAPNRKNSDKVAHCLVFCELGKACGHSETPGVDKEVFDDFVGRLARGVGLNPATSRAARQVADPGDLQANEWGQSCPSNQTCFERCAFADRKFK